MSDFQLVVKLWKSLYARFYDYSFSGEVFSLSLSGER